ncbi:MAG: arylesterase [Alphaproteobacteria bacterium]
MFTRVLKHRIVTAVTILAVSLALPAGAGAADAPRLMILGDSLTAGYGLPQDQAFPVQLEAALRANGRSVEVINAGVSGDTTAGGLARLDWALASKPTHVLVELGANDMLRAVDPGVTRKNLDSIVMKLKARGIRVMLAGMYASPNLGKRYTEAFKGLYTDLAKKHGVMLYPFFLDGVAAERELNQDDGIHPNRKGVAVIVERILPAIEQFFGEKE